jgi:hypothetical protein
MVGLTFTNTKKSIFNRYTAGSGVGSITSSNRGALKRRAYNPQCNVIETDVRYVKVFFRGTDGIIQISQLAVYVNGVNIALNGIPSAPNVLGGEEGEEGIGRPIDGTLSNRDYPDIYHSIEPSGFGYWLLDLGQAYAVDTIVYYNRNGYVERAIGMLIETYDKNYDINSPNDSIALKQFILNSGLIQTFNLQENAPSG